MEKSNREITAEIVCGCMNAWGISNGINPLTADEIPKFIQSIYDTISTLDDPQNADKN